MKNYSKSIYSSNDILGALSESLLEIDTQFKKVQQLKSLLEGNSCREEISPAARGSYAARYKQANRKHTSSLASFPVMPTYKRTASKPDFQDVFQVLPYEVPEADETEYFIEEKETAIKLKALKSKTEEKKLKELEIALEKVNNEILRVGKKQFGSESNLKKQATENLCKSIVHEILFSMLFKKTEARKIELDKEKLKMKRMATEVNTAISETERLKKHISVEMQEHAALYTKASIKEEEINKNIQKINADTRIIQQSKHHSTIKLKENQIKAKESQCLERLKALNKRKNDLEIREQRLESREKSLDLQRTPGKVPTKDENSLREKKLQSKEQSLQAIEESIAAEEQEIEYKRKEVMEKWEKMISKVDDINKQEHKTSFTNQELEEKYKEFHGRRNENERKLSTQEVSLSNQEVFLLKKMKKLEEKAMSLVEKEEHLNVQEHFLSEQKKTPKKPLVENYLSSEDEDFTAKFIERQNLRKVELDKISKEKQALSVTLTGFLSDLN